jgi:CheY-like chemotaxis protein
MKEQLNILLVEDSVPDATLIREVFEDEKIDANITVVADGISAVKYLRQEPPYEKARSPDFVILDLNMPKMSGLEVLQSIQSNPLWVKIPIIVLTTSSAEEDVASSYKMGANSFVTKPVELEQFIKIVKSIDKFWCSSVRYPTK